MSRFRRTSHAAWWEILSAGHPPSIRSREVRMQREIWPAQSLGDTRARTPTRESRWNGHPSILDVGPLKEPEKKRPKAGPKDGQPEEVDCRDLLLTPAEELAPDRRSIRELLEACRDDPARFHEEVLGRQLWSKQVAVCDAIARSPITVVPAGTDTVAGRSEHRSMSGGTVPAQTSTPTDRTGCMKSATFTTARTDGSVVPTTPS